MIRGSASLRVILRRLLSAEDWGPQNQGSRIAPLLRNPGVPNKPAFGLLGRNPGWQQSPVLRLLGGKDLVVCHSQGRI